MTYAIGAVCTLLLLAAIGNAREAKKAKKRVAMLEAAFRQRWPANSKPRPLCGSPVDARPDIVLVTPDAPMANRRIPDPGECAWTFAYDLEDGRVLHVMCGEQAKRNIMAVTLAMVTEQNHDSLMAQAHDIISRMDAQ